MTSNHQSRLDDRARPCPGLPGDRADGQVRPARALQHRTGDEIGSGQVADAPATSCGVPMRPTGLAVATAWKKAARCPRSGRPPDRGRRGTGEWTARRRVKRGGQRILRRPLDAPDVRARDRFSRADDQPAAGRRGLRAHRRQDRPGQPPSSARGPGRTPALAARGRHQLPLGQAARWPAHPGAGFTGRGLRRRFAPRLRRAHADPGLPGRRWTSCSPWPVRGARR